MKTILLGMALAFSSSAFATVNDNDTLIVESPRQVKIVTNDSLQHIEVLGSKDNPSYRYVNTIQLVDSNYVSTSSINEKTWDFSIAGFNKSKSSNKKVEFAMRLAFGFNNAPGMPRAADLQPFKSWEIWWVIADWVYKPWRNNHAFSVGVGVDWRNYRITGDQRFVQNNRVVTFDSYPANSNPQFSRIKVFSVNFPLAYEYDGKYFGFSVGPVINFNTYSSLKTRYKMDGHKIADESTGVRVNPVTIDFMCSVNIYGGPDFYVKYSPCDLLRNGYGPKFKTLSFGILLR